MKFLILITFLASNSFGIDQKKFRIEKSESTQTIYNSKNVYLVNSNSKASEWVEDIVEVVKISARHSFFVKDSLVFRSSKGQEFVFEMGSFLAHSRSQTDNYIRSAQSTKQPFHFSKETIREDIKETPDKRITSCTYYTYDSRSSSSYDSNGNMTIDTWTDTTSHSGEQLADVIDTTWKQKSRYKIYLDQKQVHVETSFENRKTVKTVKEHSTCK